MSESPFNIWEFKDGIYGECRAMCTSCRNYFFVKAKKTETKVSCPQCNTKTAIIDYFQ